MALNPYENRGRNTAIAIGGAAAGNHLYENADYYIDQLLGVGGRYINRAAADAARNIFNDRENDNRNIISPPGSNIGSVRDHSPIRSQPSSNQQQGVDQVDAPMADDMVYNGAAIRNGVVAGGNNSAGGAGGPTIPRFHDPLYDDESEIITFKTAFRVMTKSENADEGKVITLPWEFLILCHSDEHIAKVYDCGAYAWAPVSAEVYMKNVRNHAEIPIGAGGFLPVGFNHIRLRYLNQNSSSLLPRTVPFTTTGNLTKWFSATAQHEDNIVEELPKESFIMCYDETGGQLGNAANIVSTKMCAAHGLWIEKELNNGEQFHWHYEYPIGPKCTIRELMEQPYCLLKNTSGNKYQFFGAPRMDYMCGFLQNRVPTLGSFGDGFTAGNILNIPSVSKDLLTTQMLLTPDQFFTSSTDYDDGNHKIINNVSLVKSNWIPSNGIPYYDPNQQKPIYMQLEAFMNGDNIQAYQIYYTLEFIHKIRVWKNSRCSYSINNLKKFTGVTMYNVNRMPKFIYSADTEFGYINHTANVQFYMPCISNFI